MYKTNGIIHIQSQHVFHRKSGKTTIFLKGELLYPMIVTV